MELYNAKNSPDQNSADQYSLPSVLSATGSKLDVFRAIANVRNDNVDSALNVLKEFPSNSATAALRNVAVALKT